jgi:hypothetical protein
MALQLIRIERTHIKELELDQKNESKKADNSSQSADGDVTMEETNEENVIEMNGQGAKLTTPNEQIHKALYQVTPDGYVFSDISSIPHWASEKNDHLELRKYIFYVKRVCYTF